GGHPDAAEPDVRALVIAAATRLFAAHGFDGTALQDVADAVGVTKPAVLHHFPSKEHIRQAVLDGILEHWRGTLPPPLPPPTPPACASPPPPARSGSRPSSGRCTASSPPTAIAPA